MSIAKTGSTMVLASLLAGSALAQSGANMPPREIDVTKEPPLAWGEQQIAINPKNPNNIAVATVGVTICAPSDPRADCKEEPSTFYPPVPGMPGGMGKRAVGFYNNPDFTQVVVFYSMDRGKTWHRSRLPAHPVGLPRLNGQGDPSITVGPDGTFYTSWDANDWGTPEKTLPAAGVAVSMSKDGGKTWSPPVLSGTPVDGPKSAADQITGTLYVASSTFKGARSTGNPNDGLDPTNDRWVAMSKDGKTFSQPQGMGGFGANMVASHGMLATSFNTTSQSSPFASPNNQLCGTAKAPCTIFQTTQDGGKSWSRHVVPIELPPGTMPSPGAQPLIAADPTQKGRFSIGVPMNRSGEFHVYTTTDTGTTWSKSTVVSEDPSKPKYHGAMAYSPNGVLGIAWHTRLAAPPAPGAAPAGPMTRPPPSPYNIWAAISRDKGKTFSAPVKVSTADSPGGNGSGDDYSGIALDRDHLYTTWADWRPGTRANFMGAVPFSQFK